MNLSRLRARPWGTALTFFAVGVLFASAMDWTPFSHAQSSTGTANKPSASAVKSLGETSDAFVSIAEHVTPGVVAVQTRTNARPMSRQQQQQFDPRNLPPELRNLIPRGGLPGGEIPPQAGTGSGFVISSDGYIVTNNHVVANADRIIVVMTDHKRYDAKLVGRDPQTDVAVLKIDGKNLPTVALGDDEKLRVGEWVLAVGNPLGLDFTVTAGIVSAKGRGNREVPVNNGASSITDFIQTDAAINPGNSGGPLVNIRGEVVGINTAIASGTGRYEGYGFAIPVGLAKIVWEDLIKYGHIVRAQLGVGLDEVTSEDAEAAGLKKITGVKVQSCNPSEKESPACSSGVEPGDLIIELDGKSVDRVSALQRLVRAKKPGETVAVKLARFGKEVDVKVRLNQMIDSASLAVAPRGAINNADKNVGTKLGIEVQPVSETTIKTEALEPKYRGLEITDVEMAGPSLGRVFEGDIIIATAPGGTQIRTEADFARVLNAKKAGEVISLRVYNLGAKQERVVNLRVGG